MASDDLVEFRGAMPKELVAVIDAVALHEKTSRTAVMVDLARRMADDKLAQAKLLYRLTRDDPMWSDK